MSDVENWVYVVISVPASDVLNFLYDLADSETLSTRDNDEGVTVYCPAFNVIDPEKVHHGQEEVGASPTGKPGSAREDGRANRGEKHA